MHPRTPSDARQAIGFRGQSQSGLLVAAAAAGPCTGDDALLLLLLLAPQRGRESVERRGCVALAQRCEHEVPETWHVHLLSFVLWGSNKKAKHQTERACTREDSHTYNSHTHAHRGSDDTVLDPQYCNTFARTRTYTHTKATWTFFGLGESPHTSHTVWPACDTGTRIRAKRRKNG